MAKAFRLLGKQAKPAVGRPRPAIIETFPNRSPHRDYWITLDCAEFTSMCPVTGQPDFGVLRIRYIPARLCIETKSLKFYLASFRNTRAFNEEVVNRILEDLVAACAPRTMQVTGEFAPRGGIRLTAEAAYQAEET